MDIRRMQKRLYEIEEGRDTPEVEHKEVVVDGYPRGVKRFTIDVDSSSDDGEGRDSDHPRPQPTHGEGAKEGAKGISRTSYLGL